MDKMKRFLFVCFAMLCSGICSIFCALAGLHAAGFCVQEMRWLPASEKKFIAAKIVSDGEYRPIIRYSRTPDGKTEERNILVPYNNVLEFLQKNPDCCTLVPEEKMFGDSYEPITLWDRFCGAYSYGVAVKALLTEKKSINGGPEVTETKPTEIYLKFNNCGKYRIHDSSPYNVKVHSGMQ